MANAMRPDEEDDEDEGRFTDADPSTMVVGSDDTRHAELIAEARKAALTPKPKSESALASAPASKPISVIPAEGRVPERSVSGTVEGTISGASRPKFPLVLALLVIVGVVVAAFALLR